MRKFKGATATGYGPANLKGRLVLMSVALVGLVAVLFYIELSGFERGPAEPVEERVTERVVLPTIPAGTFDDVADATERERGYVEAAQLEVLRAVARQTTATAIAEAGAEPLAGEVRGRVEGDPGAARGQWFTARGEVLALGRKDTGPGSSRTELVGTLRTPDGPVHFRAARTDDDELEPGDWARVDGVFLKLLRDEVPAADGGEETLEGPLLVAPEVLRSYADFGTVTAIAPELWSEVRDDSLGRVLGPQDAMRWRLLAWMRDAPPAGPAGEEVLELDDALLAAISSDGDRYRGRTFELPVCRVQAATARKAGENPARIETYSEVWLGNTTWKREPVVCVQVPGGIETYPPGQFVRGRVVFYMNIAYDTANERRLAPLFVADTIDVFVPPRDRTLYLLLTVATGFFSAMILAIFLLVRRDRRRSEELAKKLLERRRARRAATA